MIRVAKTARRAGTASGGGDLYSAGKATPGLKLDRFGRPWRPRVADSEVYAAYAAIHESGTRPTGDSTTAALGRYVSPEVFRTQQKLYHQNTGTEPHPFDRGSHREVVGTKTPYTKECKPRAGYVPKVATPRPELTPHQRLMAELVAANRRLGLKP
jgi:hypothetical protein